MLTIRREVLRQLTEAFWESGQEEGFLLGCTSRLDCLDHCEQLPAVRVGLHFYEPDSEQADRIIRRWAEQEICFCGFIHSHVADKSDLSEADIEFAKRIYKVYCLPQLWFGIGVVGAGRVEYIFYSVASDDENTTIEPVDVCVADCNMPVLWRKQ